MSKPVARWPERRGGSTHRTCECYPPVSGGTRRSPNCPRVRLLDEARGAAWSGVRPGACTPMTGGHTRRPFVSAIPNERQQDRLQAERRAPAQGVPRPGPQPPRHRRRAGVSWSMLHDWQWQYDSAARSPTLTAGADGRRQTTPNGPEVYGAASCAASAVAAAYRLRGSECDRSDRTLARSPGFKGTSLGNT